MVKNRHFRGSKFPANFENPGFFGRANFQMFKNWACIFCTKFFRNFAKCRFFSTKFWPKFCKFCKFLTILVDHHRRNPFPEVALAIKCVSRAKKVDFSSFSGFLAQNRVVGTLFPTPPPGIKCVSRAKNVNFCQFRAIFVIFGGFRREFSGFSGVFEVHKVALERVSRVFRGFWGVKMQSLSCFPGFSGFFGGQIAIPELFPGIFGGFGGPKCVARACFPGFPRFFPRFSESANSRQSVFPGVLGVFTSGCISPKCCSLPRTPVLTPLLPQPPKSAILCFWACAREWVPRGWKVGGDAATHFFLFFGDHILVKIRNFRGVEDFSPVTKTPKMQKMRVREMSFFRLWTR